MKKNRRIAIYVIIAAIFIAALYLINNPITGSFIKENTASEPKYDYSRAGNPDYYSLLPLKPADFDEIKLMWERGIIRDVPKRIGESYWKQPEWFPNYEESFLLVLERMVEKQNLHPVWSLGVFDSQIYRRINQEWLKNPYEPETSGHGIFEIKNNSIVIKHRFWLRAAPGAIKHYGVGLSTGYPKKATIIANPKWGISGGDIEQDPEITKQYIKARIDGATEFTLGNYWPKLSPDYIKEIWVEVEIDKDTPKGKYIVQVNAEAPSRNYQQKQSLKYGLAYTDPNLGVFAGPARFRLFVEII